MRSHQSSRIPSRPSKVTFDSSSSSRLYPLLAVILSTQYDLQHDNTIVRKREAGNGGKVLSGCFEVDRRVRVWVKVVVIDDVRCSAFETSLPPWHAHQFRAAETLLERRLSQKASDSSSGAAMAIALLYSASSHDCAITSNTKSCAWLTSAGRIGDLVQYWTSTLSTIDDRQWVFRTTQVQYHHKFQQRLRHIRQQ
ncbi:uncharacterized protein K489DRAFT_77740 [Dissoconium aciculare CBS 342.82]|jgi:hypothetical protein|uniref:Uncharacterized protein n=1 Tax=Dissoconium aciculare CBS 342.82 TaxID=1314786 RepID=A0A6J3LVC4_9PEZI|nr:uncharacterized protein K489DRAFT_77740 [Dissoconium aciculare CBS 342.82]KAF1819239.1 hypothetical protein K489DRAFT_77740 [Dissoconium aciculare CBS 342.82]